MSTVANYQRYTGGVVGEVNGKQTFINVDVASDVVVSGLWGDFDCSIGGIVGGITGMAHYGNTFVNCVCTGNVYLTEYENDEDVTKVGGIAGIWHNQNGTSVTFRGCSFSGSIFATKNTGEACDASEFDDQQTVGAAYSADMTGTLVVE